jgi:Zn finger protein HypA/HybF involved in hydrogenase expression
MESFHREWNMRLFKLKTKIKYCMSCNEKFINPIYEEWLIWNEYETRAVCPHCKSDNWEVVEE